MIVQPMVHITNLIMKRQQTNPDQGIFDKITGLYLQEYQGHDSQRKIADCHRLKEAKEAQYLNATLNRVLLL